MPNNNMKAPSQVFRWFEKMKSNYENSVQAILTRFENHTETQQKRIDATHQEHISSVKQLHNEQMATKQQHIDQLQQDIHYYKQQISQHQQTIEQLNSRYDTVMACMLSETKSNVNVKDIFDSKEFLTDLETTEPESNFVYTPPGSIPTEEAINSDEEKKNTTSITGEHSNDAQLEEDPDWLFQQAINYRDNENLTLAIELLETAAELEHPKAMGALGRAYFLGEGVEECPITGLSWLIKAADAGLPQAISRVEYFMKEEPELFDKVQGISA